MEPTRIDQLVQLISINSDRYHNGESVVSDGEWDAWVAELTVLDPDNPILRQVGAPISAQNVIKYRHQIPMGSLHKVNDPDELGRWYRSIDNPETLWCCEKLDGVSIALQYIDGRFYQAVSRGDGVEGEILVHASRLEGVPPQLPIIWTGWIRGEIVMLKHRLTEQYANTRNAVSGIIHRSDGEGVDTLTVYCYWVSDTFRDRSVMWGWLTRNGFLVPSGYRVGNGLSVDHGFESVPAIMAAYRDHTRATLPYDIDGMVVSVFDIELERSLGETSGRPKGSIAYKFDPPSARSTILDIVWNVGATGRLTPVAGLQPVDLLGTTVKQASLYNYRYIEELGIGIGAVVEVVRANDVIPRVQSVIVHPDCIAQPPTHCPSCNTELISESVDWVCPNPQCESKTLARLVRYIKAINVKEWGESLLESVINQYDVQTPDQLYGLSVDQLSVLNRMGKRSATTAYKSLHDKPVPIGVLMGGLSIPHCGVGTCTSIVQAGYISIEQWQSLEAKHLVKIEGIGPDRAEGIEQWIREHDGLLDRIGSVIPIEQPKIGVLTGKSFCITGSTSIPRKELEHRIVQVGGVVKGSVGKGLDYCITNDPSGSSSKLTKARGLGITIIDEPQLLKMISGEHD